MTGANGIEIDPRGLDTLEQEFLTAKVTRVSGEKLWRSLARAFPHRTTGPAERRLLLDVLNALVSRGSIRLPPKTGKRWDRSMDPAVPTSVDIIRERGRSSALSWRTFPWHPRLHWVAECRNLSLQQVKFLRRVHEGLVNGAFREPAPLKYRSLQLTGDEKALECLTTTSLFGDSRLSLDLLACLREALPLAWEAVGDGGRVVIFENAGPFAVARRVLGKLRARPYDMIAYGGGRSVLAALGHLKTIERNIESIHYVGDLDHAGLDIAWGVQRCSEAHGLPSVQPATELHRQMLAAAHAFGHSHGWPTQDQCPALDSHRNLGVLSPAVRQQVEIILRAGHRIPEEVLGPDELRVAWAAR